MREKKIFYIAAALLMTAGLIFGLTACQQNDIVTNNEGETGIYETSDRIIIPVTKIRSINPANSTDEDVYQITRLVYNSLIRLDDTLEPVGDLAATWNYTENGSLQFTLRSDVRWSDGSALTSSDVSFTVQALKKAGKDSPYASKVRHIRDISVTDDHTFTVHLDDPSDTSAADFSFPIFPSSQFSNVSSFLENTSTPVMGTGPYQITAASLGKKIELAPNEYTFETRPRNTVTLQVMPVDDLYPGLVSSGVLSIMVVDKMNREELEGDSSLNVTQFTGNEAEVLGFRCSGQLSDASLRRAIAMAVDRDEIISGAYFGSGIKSDDLYFPGYLGTETTNEFSADASDAQNLMKQAGYEDRDGDGIAESVSGAPVKLTLVTNTDNNSRLMAAQMIQRQLASIGISVTLAETTSEGITSAVNSNSYDMFLAGWRIDERYDLREFYHSGYSNPANYANPDLNTLLDKMFSAVSEDQKKETLSGIKSILADDVPYLCICYKTYAAVTSKDFDGFVAPRFNDYYFGCPEWNVKFFRKIEEDTEDGTGTNGIQAGKNEKGTASDNK